MPLNNSVHSQAEVLSRNHYQQVHRRLTITIAGLNNFSPILKPLRNS